MTDENNNDKPTLVPLGIPVVLWYINKVVKTTLTQEICHYTANDVTYYIHTTDTDKIVISEWTGPNNTDTDIYRNLNSAIKKDYLSSGICLALSDYPLNAKDMRALYDYVVERCRNSRNRDSWKKIVLKIAEQCGYVEIV